MADLSKQIGRRIRMLRHERPASRSRRVNRMTLEELAEAADLSPDYVAKLEAGKHSPTAESLVKLAGALEVDPGELFPPSTRGDATKAAAVDQLVAYVTRYSPSQINYCLDVLRVVLEKRPVRRATKKRTTKKGSRTKKPSKL